MKSLLQAKSLVSKKLGDHDARKKWGNESIQRNLQKSLLYLDNAIEMIKVAEQRTKPSGRQARGDAFRQ
jgi:hypothetical protein